MKVKDIQHLAEINSKKKLKVFNPTTKDFKWKYNRKEYTIPKGEVKEFKYHLAQHLAKHLIDKIMTENSLNTRPSKERKMWEKKILI